MKSLYSLVAFVSLALLANCIYARRDSGEYWRQSHDFNDDMHAKPRLVQGHVHVAKVTSVSNEKKGDCKHDSVEPSLAKYKQLLASDFEPRPSVTAYVDNLKPNEEQSYTKEFEPRPSVTTYVGDLKPNKKQSYTKDFEPRPSATSYVDDLKPNNEQSYTKEFEPRPNISAYTGDAKQEDNKSFVKDIEPRPNISAYTDDVKQEDGKSFVKDFEPWPNVSAYDDHATAAEAIAKDLENGKNGSV